MNQIVVVRIAMAITAGTKKRLILSANFAILGFVRVASSTSLIISETNEQHSGKMVSKGTSFAETL